VGTPDAGAFWRVVAEHGSPCCSPPLTALRAISSRTRAASSGGRYDPEPLSHLFLAGSACDPDTLEWAGEAGRAGHRPLVADRDRLGDRGQLPGHRSLPVEAGSRVPAPGYDVAVLGPGGGPAPRRADSGPFAIRAAPPPATSHPVAERRGLHLLLTWTRFPGYYLTGDAGYEDEDGYLWIMSRIDDIINVAGHRDLTGAWRRCSPPTPTWPSAR